MVGSLLEVKKYSQGRGKKKNPVGGERADWGFPMGQEGVLEVGVSGSDTQEIRTVIRNQSRSSGNDF